MIGRKILLFIVILLSFFWLLTHAASSNDEPDYEEDYPPDMDSLEEFIQSFYLLLEGQDYLKDYDFIDQQENHLHNGQAALTAFYHKLLELRSGRREQVVIYQIGDSHIQSGFFGGSARKSLQNYFGNSGRGLIFPHRLIGTNQPDDYRISSTGSFSRITQPRSVIGYTLKLRRPAKLDIRTNCFYQNDPSFDLVKVLANPDATLPPQPSVKGIQRDNHADISIHSLHLPEAVRRFELQLSNDVNALYGISLENSRPGLLYHSVGVNGAGFYNLADQGLLFDQIKYLSPDLIIISLGTNDAQGSFCQEVMQANLERFMQHLTQANPNVAVLFTLPPDSLKEDKINPDLASVEEIIRTYARENDMAWWDLHAVMGGPGSIRTWQSRQMSATDFLHYNPGAYMLHGQLLYQAIIQGYIDFSEN